MSLRQRLAFALALLAGTGTAQATNGYFSHGYSVAQRALGGAGTAYGSDALVVSINPANVVLLPERFDLNIGLFSPRRSFTAGERGPNAGPGVLRIEPGEHDSQRELFGIPAMAYSRPIDDRSSWGVALYGNGGMNTDYRGGSARFGEGLSGLETECAGTFGGGPSTGSADPAGFCGNGITTTSIDLIQLFVVPSYARKIGEVTAIGIAPVIAAQRFTARGLKAFAQFSNAPDRVSDNRYDYSYGAGYRVGVTLEAIPSLAVGGSYQSRIAMSEFDKYAGLFAEDGDFDIPSTWNAGIALGLGPGQRLLVDYQHVNFSEVRAVGNPLDPNRFVNECALPRLGGDDSASDACLGATNGPGFGWRDVSTVKFGYELTWDDTRWRVGYSKNHQPIPADEVLFNILAPAVPEEHYTAGLSYRMNKAWFFDVSAVYVRNHPVRGKNPLSNSTASESDLAAAVLLPGSADTSEAFGSDPDDQDITLEMKQYELTFGLSYLF